MAARSIWSGPLRAGLVTFNVKLYKATDEASKDTSMRTLHDACSTPLNQNMHCAKCAVDVPNVNQVMAVATPNGFVVLTDDDLKTIRPATSEGINVEAFIPADSVDSLYVECSYYLMPDKGQQQAYALLCTAMSEAGRVMQSRLTLRNREHIVVIRPRGLGMILEMVRPKNLVRDMSELPTFIAEGSVTIDKSQLKLAAQLVQMMSEPFDATDYEDGYVVAFKALVQKKVNGEAIVPVTETPKLPGNVDLLSALKASLETKPVKPVKKAKTVAPKKTKK